jgi:tocopherol cyclase
MKKIIEYFKYDLWRVMYPLAYHGEKKEGPFFEGWYFKLVSENGKNRISIIPGVYIGKDEADSHAFIQIIDGVKGNSHYLTYPISDFHHVPKSMQVSIAENHFSERNMQLNINQNGFRATGKLVFQDLSFWPVQFTSPGIMGWYGWVPSMECYHGIVSMDHHIEGTLIINNQAKDFSKGRGYMEKDWGMAMPNAWIWMQSNHFKKKGTSLTISIAEIPWGNRHFDGFLAGLLFDGKLFRFATYTGAKVKALSVSDKLVKVSIEDSKNKLFISAHRSDGHVLQAPTTIQMDRRIMETLSAQIEIVFHQKINGQWRQIYADTGAHAGLEVVGNLKNTV